MSYYARGYRSPAYWAAAYWSIAAPSQDGYHVYWNSGGGGAVDYEISLADVPAPSHTWTSAGLADGDYTFAVRAFFGATRYEDKNVQLLVRVIIAGGVDVSAIPNSPIALLAHQAAGGAIVVAWSYAGTAEAATPDKFQVWATAGPTVDWAGSPAATVQYSAAAAGPMRHYATTLAGLADGVTYAIGVRALAGTLDDGNTGQVAVTADATAPGEVVGLTATPIVGGT
jgi:hypothetical protein